jgi:hypothetical protein
MQASPLNYLNKLEFSRAYNGKLLNRELLINPKIEAHEKLFAGYN